MPPETVSVSDVLKGLRDDPGEVLLRKWNWKAAVFSSILRGVIFLVMNLAAGWRAATGAFLAEFFFRTVISGFYGSLTQAFRNATPEWLALVMVLIVMPLITHSLELAMHMATGTAKLLRSMIASVAFTELATLFNLYAMRRGALVVGNQAPSMIDDLRRIPNLIAGFIVAGPMAVVRGFARQEPPRPVVTPLIAAETLRNPDRKGGDHH